MNTLSKLQKKIVENGVKNLKEFGYPDCNSENIFTDAIYGKFFKGMLEDNLGKGYDSEVNPLIAMIP